jgi:vancomycin permeability regulator SanA
MQKSIRNSVRLRRLKRAGWFILIWIVIHIVFITVDGLIDYKGKADVAIILGNAVYADGSLSPWLKGRVDAALELYRQHRVKKIFASGGLGTDESRHFPEGDAMRNYLVKEGVPAADIIVDNAGVNTYFTAKNFIAWNQSQHDSTAIVVSQFYHITRSKYIMQKLGFEQVYGVASTDYTWRDIIGTLREVPAFYKYLLVY